MVQDLSQEQLIALQKRTVKVLSLGQSLGGFGLGATLSVGALLAVELSGTTAWSGAAATLSTLGSAAAAIPLANLAFKRGRRVSLAFGAFLAIFGAMTMILATYTRSFPVEIVALLFLGAGSAVSLQARFAAADIPTGKPKGRDLSLVVWATNSGCGNWTEPDCPGRNPWALAWDAAFIRALLVHDRGSIELDASFLVWAPARPADCGPRHGRA